MEVSGSNPLDASDTLVLAAHVLFCCAGLIPEPQGDAAATAYTEGGMLQPVALETSVKGLPATWRGVPGCGCYTIR